WHYPHYHGGSGMKPGGAMRKGDYKLIVWYEELLMDTSDPYELYNVSQDMGETVDLKDELPGKAREMIRDFEEWQEEVDAQMPSVR
ncbi:MAG: sulfatase, partial [Bacteroidota bacterium]